MFFVRYENRLLDGNRFDERYVDSVDDGHCLDHRNLVVDWYFFYDWHCFNNRHFLDMMVMDGVDIIWKVNLHTVNNEMIILKYLMITCKTMKLNY